LEGNGELGDFNFEFEFPTPANDTQTEMKNGWRIADYGKNASFQP
jgi:hypothetical protein